MTERRRNQEKRAAAREGSRAGDARAAAEQKIPRDDLAALQELLGAEVLEQSPEGTAIARVRSSYFVVDGGIVQVNTLSLPYARERFAQLSVQRRRIVALEKKEQEREAAIRARREAEAPVRRELAGLIIEEAKLVLEKAGHRVR